jgi:hypothetical protein
VVSFQLSYAKGIRHHLLVVSLLPVLVATLGCASARKPNPEALAAALCGLGPEVQAAEAATLARTACDTSSRLARDYAVVRPAILHNCLVNMRLKKRGLCFHWAEDLEPPLRALDLQSLEVHRAVARRATRREHNALVVTAPNAPFHTGLVLDAWRDGGRLVWAPVATDKYPWQLDIGLEPAPSGSESTGATAPTQLRHDASVPP